MSLFEPLSEGQHVFLRRPVQIYAKVVGLREGSSGMPGSQAHYAVQLLPLQQYYLPEELEPAVWLQFQQTSAVESKPPETEKRIERPTETALSVTAGRPPLELEEQINALIERRAYELYARRGFEDGHHAEDWQRATAEIVLQGPVEIEESETDLTVRADVPGFRKDDLEVRVSPRMICITGKRQGGSKQSPEASYYSERRPNRIFRVVELAAEIDPGAVEAWLGDGILEIKLLKAVFAR